MNATITEKLQGDIEITGRNIRAAKLNIELAVQASNSQRRALDDLEVSLRTILERGLLNNNPRVMTEVAKALERMDRLRELRNMEELGGFQVQVNRAMQNAWEALP